MGDHRSDPLAAPAHITLSMLAVAYLAATRAQEAEGGANTVTAT